MSDKKEKPDLVGCSSCGESGKCPNCKGSGIEVKFRPGFGLRSEKVITISCTVCGKGEEIGEDGIVASSKQGEKGSGECKTCDGLGWIVKTGKLQQPADEAS